MYHQVFDPVAGSLPASAAIAALPLLTLFVTLGGLRWEARWAALASLAVALVVAVAAYSMPVGQAALSASEGAVFGLFPIMWIVINAIWVFKMTERTGHFSVLRRAFGRISDDQRIQAIVVAFSFGALIEGLAGFGAPVAISAVVLLGLGFQPGKAVVLGLIGNTAPVAFGSIAIPIVTLAQTTGLPKDDLGAMVGRQTPFLALFIPFILAGVAGGRRGVREVWPAAAVAGLTFAVTQFASSNYVSVELADIFAALVSAAATMALLRVWHPAMPASGGRTPAGRPSIAGAAVADPLHEGAVRRRDRDHDSGGEIAAALAPYLIIIAVFMLAQLGPIKDALAGTIQKFDWPGLHLANPKGEAVKSVTFTFNYLPAAGTLMLLCGLLTAAVLRVRPRDALRTYGQTLRQLAPAIMTVMAVLALAYVMNQSGETLTLAKWIAGIGSLYAFFASLVGWLGVAVTGSDTSSNALFGTLQVQAAQELHLPSVLLAAANSSGGVLGKMLSPQNLAIGAAAVGIAGKEGDLFRRVVVWSVVLALAMGALVYLQSTSLLDWMVP